ncbi:N-acetylneuraminate synthase [Desulfosporosinus sp. Tol-M]|nr:N-acetylneuraminate synthase [Desulfosporosinus sp. Tol-M]
MKLFDNIKNNKIYIVAEMSANHGGSLQHALEVAHAAKEAEADCLKIQTYTADTITIDCDNDFFKVKGGLWDGYTRYQLYKEAYTPWEWQGRIKEECQKIGLDFFSSPFDPSAVDFLESIGTEAYKIASPELVDIPLIEYTAKKGKPMVMSCGMANPEEINAAIAACERNSNYNIILLKCTTEYPAPISDMNLLTIPDMQNRFGYPVGLSDHTMGFTADVVAVALGAVLIEKHFCISKNETGADIAFSMDFDMFRDMVKAVRETKELLGKCTYELSEGERRARNGRRSLFAVKDIGKGDIITEVNVRSIRPGVGLPPIELKNILGRKATVDIPFGTPISMEGLE